MVAYLQKQQQQQQIRLVGQREVEWVGLGGRCWVGGWVTGGSVGGWVVAGGNFGRAASKEGAREAMLGGWVGNGWVGRWVGGGRGELGRAASEEGAREAMGEARVVAVVANLALLPRAAAPAAAPEACPQQQQQ